MPLESIWPEATSGPLSSPLGMLSTAGPVVQAIVLVLVLASVAAWSIMIGRVWAMYKDQRKTRLIATEFTNPAKTRDLKFSCSVVSCGVGRILKDMIAEWDWSIDNRVQNHGEARGRILSAGELAIARETTRLAGNISVLATIGSVAPFVGLLGTVWGIVGSFVAIGASQDTSLATVAPGIAEALMATAIGLACAIPAVIGYNRLLLAVARREAEWRDLAGRLEILISRDFEDRR